MIKRVDRFIGGTALLGMLTVWLGLSLLMLMFSFLDQLGSMQGGYQLREVLWFMVLTAPRNAYQVFPASALLGSMIAIGGLAATNELVALRTAGVSRLRISASVLGTTLLLSVPVMLLGELVAPGAERTARAFKLSAITGQDLIGGRAGIWIREGNEFINIRRPLFSARGPDDAIQLHDLAIFWFDDRMHLSRITRVEVAKPQAQSSDWLLEGVQDLMLDPGGIELEQQAELTRATRLKPELLDSAMTRPPYMSIRALLEQLDYLGRNGLDGRVYESALFSKLFYPLTALALVLAGMPFVFGSSRHHSMGARLFIGMSLGGLFIIVNRAVQNLGDAYHLPAMLSAIAPSLLLTVAVIWLLRRAV